MGRLPADATPDVIAVYNIATDGIWQLALNVMADEANHNLQCADPDCPGIVQPWINNRVNDLDTARTLLAVIMQRMADGATGAHLLDGAPAGKDTQ